MSHFSSLAILLLLSSNSLKAIEKISDDEIVIISADKINTSNKKVSSQVEVINDQKIDHFKNKSLDELLSNYSGLNITKSGQTGTTSSVSIRGMDTSHTIVVLDGIILNDPTNPNRQFDFSKVNLNNIDKIEILKGSQGLLYGSNAIGGVVVLTSKKVKKDSTDIEISYGTYSTKELSLNTNRIINNNLLNLGFDFYHTQGFSSSNDYTHPNDKDGNQKINLNFGLSGSLLDGYNYEFKSYFLNEKIDLDKGGGPNSDDPNFMGKNQTLYSKLGISKIFNDFLKSELRTTRTEFNRRSFDQNDSFQTYNGSDYQKGNNQTFELDNTLYINDIYTQNINLGHAIESDIKNTNSSSNIFFYNKIEFDKSNLNFGLRLDYNKIFKEALTYKLAISHQFNKLNFRSSFSTGIKSPTLFQLFDQTYGNSNLKPEKSRSLDLGFDQDFGNLKQRTTFYYTHLNDRHYYQNSLRKNINFGSSYSKGIEEEVELSLTEKLKQVTNLNLNESFDLNTGSRLSRRPELILNHGLTFIYEEATHFINAKFKSNTQDVDNNGSKTKNKKYVTLNYDFEYELKNNQSFGLNIENIFNSHFQEIWGYNNGGRMINLRYKIIL